MTKKSLKTIGENLRKARLEQHLTQVDIANAADISINFYAMIERGESNPSLEVFEKILKVLNVKSSKILPY